MFIEPRSEVLIQLLSERHSISLLKELRVVMAFAGYKYFGPNGLWDVTTL